MADNAAGRRISDAVFSSIRQQSAAFARGGANICASSQKTMGAHIDTLRAMSDEFDRGCSLSDAFGCARVGTRRDRLTVNFRQRVGERERDGSSRCGIDAGFVVWRQGSSPHVYQETVEYEWRRRRYFRDGAGHTAAAQTAPVYQWQD
jgi:hypothetical protein